MKTQYKATIYGYTKWFDTLQEADEWIANMVADRENEMVEE